MELPKLSKPQRWGLINGTFALFVVLGPGFGVAGATNIALFLAWLTFFMSSLFLNKDAKEIMLKQLKEKNESFSMVLWADVLFDLSIISVFLWNNFWFTAIAYLIHTIIMFRIRQEIEKGQKDNDN